MNSFSFCLFVIIIACAINSKSNSSQKIGFYGRLVISAVLSRIAKMGEGVFLRINIRLLKIFAIYPRKENAGSFLIILDFLHKYITLACLYCVFLPCVYELYLGEKSKITDYTLNIMNTGKIYRSFISFQILFICKLSIRTRFSTN